MLTQVHGGDIYRHKGVIDFSSNMNPLGTPEGVIRAAQESMTRISNYPDVFQTELIESIAAYEGVPAEQIICGNGAAELIFMFAAALRPKQALILAPTFAEYEQALHSAGCGVRLHTLREQNGFTLTESILGDINSRLDVVILCNPNNPTGRLVDPELLGRIIDRCKELGIWLMIDECFQDFCDAWTALSAKDRLADAPKLFLLKAFTKRYAMAGIRLGYGLCADEKMMDAMRRTVQPWNVSIPAQEAGIAALKETAYVEEARRIVKEERAFLKQELARLGFTVYDSMANYIFFRGPEGLVEHALKSGILIRDCSNYHGLGRGYYRVAVRRHEDNMKLIEALR